MEPALTFPASPESHRPRFTLRANLLAVALVAANLALLRAEGRPNRRTCGRPEFDQQVQAFATLPAANVLAFLAFRVTRRDGVARRQRVRGLLAAALGLCGLPGLALLVNPFKGKDWFNPLLYWLWWPGAIPGGLALAWFLDSDSSWMVFAYGVASALLLIGLYRLGARGGYWQWAASLLGVLVSTPPAFFSMVFGTC